MKFSRQWADKAKMDGITAPPLPTSRTRRRAPQSVAGMLAEIGSRILIVAAVMAGGLALLYFPWEVDAPLTKSEMADLEKYYATAYADQGKAKEEPVNSDYVRIAETFANGSNATEAVAYFAKMYGLHDQKVLDVGAGRGYLQDVVPDYTGLDISPSAVRFFHKKFVHASATYMPFQDSEFDAAWSIRVFEHVPNPEAALREIRRVVKDGGLILLSPAWDCRSWAADGYPVRPYGEFGVGGKLYKASLPLQEIASNYARVPIRFLREAAWRVAGGPTALHYRRMKPNYDKYWMADSDAVNILDRHEMAIWFTSRGDECLNCETAMTGWLDVDDALVIRVHKKAAPKT
ncbi:MAG: methyltransferase domain-containing protein [Acidobacteriota bacterium]